MIMPGTPGTCHSASSSLSLLSVSAVVKQIFKIISAPSSITDHRVTGCSQLKGGHGLILAQGP